MPRGVDKSPWEQLCSIIIKYKLAPTRWAVIAGHFAVRTAGVERHPTDSATVIIDIPAPYRYGMESPNGYLQFGRWHRGAPGFTHRTLLVNPSRTALRSSARHFASNVIRTWRIMPAGAGINCGLQLPTIRWEGDLARASPAQNPN